MSRNRAAKLHLNMVCYRLRVTARVLCHRLYPGLQLHTQFIPPSPLPVSPLSSIPFSYIQVFSPTEGIFISIPLGHTNFQTIPTPLPHRIAYHNSLPDSKDTSIFHIMKLTDPVWISKVTYFIEIIRYIPKLFKRCFFWSHSIKKSS